MDTENSLLSALISPLPQESGCVTNFDCIIFGPSNNQMRGREGVIPFSCHPTRPKNPIFWCWGRVQNPPARKLSVEGGGGTPPFR